MLIEAIIIGAATGFISAFFGIGGSSIDTPLLRMFLHLPPYLALASPLPTALLTIFIALLAYWKKHLVDFRIFRWSILGGLPGMIAGSYLSHIFSGRFLMLASAAVLFLVGGDFILKKISSAKKNRKHRGRAGSISVAYITSVAFALSMLSGILANGGGLFFIPAYVLLFRLEMKEAIATSLLTVAVMILPACFIHYGLGHIDLGVSAAMGIGVIPMAYMGAKLDLKTKSDTLQLLFGLLLVIFSVYFFISQMA
jgi:uncharacterized membrane protein YfcA